MIDALAQGFLLLIGVTIPVGAQNAWVLGRGIARSNHLSAALTCWLCDVVLLAIGVFGWSALVSKYSGLVDVLTVAGVVFLSIFGLTCLRSVWLSFSQPTRQSTNPFMGTGQMTRGAVIVATLGVTLLNPHKYLDTLVIMGALANDGFADMRIPFYVGCLAGSFAWFAALSFGGLKAGNLMQTRPFRVTFDLIVAIAMLTIAASMAGQMVLDSAPSSVSAFGS